MALTMHLILFTTFQNHFVSVGLLDLYIVVLVLSVTAETTSEKFLSPREKSWLQRLIFLHFLYPFNWQSRASTQINYGL